MMAPRGPPQFPGRLGGRVFRACRGHPAFHAVVEEPGDTVLLIVDETDLGDDPNTLAGDLIMAADVLISDHGSVALFTPMTPDAYCWVEENVQVEPWQRFGLSVACEPRCLDSLVEGMREGGLVVEPE